MKSYTGGHPLESVVGDIAKERDAALSRAEAAERRVAELEAQRDDYHMKWVDVGFELGQFADDLIAVLKLQLTDNDDEATTLATIVTRVTELEARLAEAEAQAVDWDWQPTEQEWRPKTERPEHGQHVQIIVDDVEFLIGDGWYGDGFFFDPRAMFEWRPLPPPPSGE